MNRFPTDWNTLAQDASFLRDSQGKPIHPKELSEASVGISQPASIISSLVEFHGEEHVQCNMLSLNIHIVGATNYYEIEHINDYINVFNEYLPHCKISISFIGLCLESYDHIVSPNFGYRCYESTYSRFIADHCNEQQPPDIIVCFNPGFHSFLDSWDECLSCILRLNVPTLITAYSRDEIYADYKLFNDRYAAAVIREPSKNIFRSLLPMQDPCEESYYYFDNSFIFHIQGLLE